MTVISKPSIVANEVLRRVRKGKKINLSEIQRNAGYSPSSVRAHKAIKTKEYKDIVIPVTQKMKELHAKAINNLSERDLTKERMDSVVNLAKQMIHDTQLLEGKATENIANNVVVYGSDDFLATQIDSNVKQDNQ